MNPETNGSLKMFGPLQVDFLLVSPQKDHQGVGLVGHRVPKSRGWFSYFLLGPGDWLPLQSSAEKRSVKALVDGKRRGVEGEALPPQTEMANLKNGCSATKKTPQETALEQFVVSYLFCRWPVIIYIYIQP